jgi:pimeloyl-ACP methyl ester carboxylesterase
MTNNTSTFERPDLFELDTWGKQIEDMHQVNKAVATGQLAGQGLPVIWFGHSRGGLVTILAAARLFDQQSPIAPAGIIPAASPHVACNLDDMMRQLMHQEGSLSSPSSRTKQDLRLGLPWLKEIEADPDAFDPVLCIARITCPILLIQGEVDTTVRVASANALYSGTGNQARLQVIADAGHTFNCPNPLPTDDDAPAPTHQMAQLVCDFAKQVSA